MDESSGDVRVAVAPPERGSSRRCALNSWTPFADLPELLSPEEFRAVAGIGRTAMYDLLRRGDLPHVKFGRCIRIPKAALHAANS